MSDDLRKGRVEDTNWSMPCRLIFPAVDRLGLPEIGSGKVAPRPRRASAKVTLAGRATDGTGLPAGVGDLSATVELVVPEGRGGGAERKISELVDWANFC
jgi:hypothetical protein